MQHNGCNTCRESYWSSVVDPCGRGLPLPWFCLLGQSPRPAKLRFRYRSAQDDTFILSLAVLRKQNRTQPHGTMQTKRAAHRAALFASQLFILTLACSFGLLLTLYAGLFVMLSLAKFGKDTGSCALALEPTQSTVKGFALFQLYFCHFCFPPLAVKTIVLCYYTRKVLSCQEIFKTLKDFFAKSTETCKFVSRF